MSKIQSFGVDSKLKQLINVNTFQEDYSIVNFIESITETQLTQAKKENTEFEPRQFIRTFENAIEELVKLQNEVQSNIDFLEDEVQKEEENKKMRTKELTSAFEDVFKAFETLESRIGEVGNTAIRIGEQLENIDKQRERAVDSRDLIQYFIDFNEGNCEKLDKLVESGIEGEYEATVIVRKLNNLKNEIDAQGTEKAKSVIEKYSEDLERNILEKFDKAYKENNIEDMTLYTKSLMNFNSGNSCIQMYINQNKLFLLSETQEFRCDSEEESNDISTPNKDLLSLYDEIRSTCKYELTRISKIFPNSVFVMQLFIQRIFGQTIQTYIEGILKSAQNISSKVYLRNLYSSYIATKELINELNEILSKNVPSIYSYLERYLQDIFVPYLNNYLINEKKFLTETYEIELGSFIAYHTNRKENLNKTVFHRAFNSITASSGTIANNISSSLTNTPISSHNVANRFLVSFLDQGKSAIQSNISNSPNLNNDQINQNNITFTEESGKLNTEICMKIINIHSEAIIRCNELSISNDLSQNIKELFEILLNYLGKFYIELALDMEIDEFSSMDTKSEPDFKHLITFKLSNEFIHILQKHFQTTILPFIMSYPTVHRQIVEMKNNFISRMEEKLNIVLQKQINCLINWLSVLLQRQKKNDFKPKEDSISSSSSCSNTQACLSCVEFLEKTYTNMQKYLNKSSNFQSFIVELGIMFFGMLLEHYKKYGTNSTGALILTKDIAAYRRLIEDWNSTALAVRYDMLVQLGNLAVIDPENLESLITEGYLAKIEPSLLRPYLIARSDWNTFTKAQKEMFYESNELDKNKTDDLISQFQALKTMMNEKKYGFSMVQS